MVSTMGSLLTTLSMVSYSATLVAILLSMFMAARVDMLPIGVRPWTKRTGLPISVALPNASSTASRPLIFLRNIPGCRLAWDIKKSTSVENTIMITRLLSFERSNQLPLAGAETTWSSPIITAAPFAIAKGAADIIELDQ